MRDLKRLGEQENTTWLAWVHLHMQGNIWKDYLIDACQGNLEITDCSVSTTFGRSVLEYGDCREEYRTFVERKFEKVISDMCEYKNMS